MLYLDTKEVNNLEENEMLNPKEVGRRVRERRLELGLSMADLGNRVGVNKSTIQRYEKSGVDPKRAMIINGLAEALETTPQWLAGLSDEKDNSVYAVCQRDIEEHVLDYLKTVTSVVAGEPHQRLLTTILGQLIDLYAVMTSYWASSMRRADEVIEDAGLKEYVRKLSISTEPIIRQVYQKEMEIPIGDMKDYLDGILHIYDKDWKKASVLHLYDIVDRARKRLDGQDT